VYDFKNLNMIQAPKDNYLFAGNEGITTVAVKTLKESATEVDRKDLLSELEVSWMANRIILANQHLQFPKSTVKSMQNTDKIVTTSPVGSISRLPFPLSLFIQLVAVAFPAQKEKKEDENILTDSLTRRLSTEN